MILTQTAQEFAAKMLEKHQILDMEYSIQQGIFEPKDIFLKISVQPGGCAGLKYQIYFEYEKHPEDQIIKFDKFDLRIDKMSWPYLQGATMDYKETIHQQGFSIDNPNAQGGCACGDSFN